MNPFLLSGPEFLVFYAILSAILLGALFLWSRRDPLSYVASSVDTTDPYLIALLRGGRDESVQVAVVSLIDRGLLTAEGTIVVAARPDAADLVRRPIERAIVEHFAAPKSLETAVISGPVAMAAADYERRLAEAGFLRSPERRQMVKRQAVLVAAGLLIVAIAKIVLAVESGRSNVLFLVSLAGIDLVIASSIARQSRTEMGNARLADLRNLLGGLRNRSADLQPGGSTNEIALLAAVFGIQAVPLQFATAVAPYKATHRRSPSTGFDGDSDSGLWRSSSNGDGAGGSCGGGGGGCGGCGG